MATSDHVACSECGFSLFAPLAELPATTVGLYDDARYPGRLIVSMREHHSHMDQLPEDALAAFMRDVTHCSRVLRSLHGVVRVNVAVLGNREPHVHAHVIPRRVGEVNRTRAPWDGAEPHHVMEPHHLDTVMTALRERLSL